tara:strand:+ start:440 stop:736 length:297 start_codon:yes stop_codon:yes gene_type:complete
MSILAQQINMSKAMVNGRTIADQQGPAWVMSNLTTSQLRDSETDSDLVSGYFGGGDLESGGRVHRYPDNRPILEGSDVVSSSIGIERIRDSRTAAQLG